MLLLLTNDKFPILILNSDQSRLMLCVVCCILSRNTTVRRQKTHTKEAPPAAQKPDHKKCRVKEEMDSRKQEREKVHLNERLNNLESIIQSIIF